MTLPTPADPVRVKVHPGYTPTQEVLAQALDIIEATYWVRNHEVLWLTSAAVVDDQILDKAFRLQVRVDHASSAQGPLRNFTPHGDDVTAGVVGVCSIGAMALARCQVNDAPWTGFMDIYMMDPAVRVATYALAATIARKEDEPRGDGLVETITTWNDDGDTKREDVVRVFSAAIAHPICLAGHAVIPTVRLMQNNHVIGHHEIYWEPFVTLAEAEEWLATLQNDREARIALANKCRNSDDDLEFALDLDEHWQNTYRLEMDVEVFDAPTTAVPAVPDSPATPAGSTTTKENS